MNWLAAVGKRLWFGLNPELRKSRFHTQKGQYALGSLVDAADCIAAVATGVAHKVVGLRLMLPWITFPAMRFLWARMTPNTRVFEWSCGMSTLWFERRCGAVWAVEDDAAWYSTIVERAKRAKVFRLEGRAYVEKILQFPAGYFGLISVDGSYRLECFRLALEHTPAGGLLVVDNTDRTTEGDLLVIDGILNDLGAGWEVHRFPGWGPGNFFVWETTVCVRR